MTSKNLSHLFKITQEVSMAGLARVILPRLTALLTLLKGRIMAFKDAQVPTTCDMLLAWQKGLCRCDYSMDLEMGRLSWLVQLGPTKSEELLEVESISSW